MRWRTPQKKRKWMLLTLPIEQKFDMEKLPTFSKRHGQNIRKIRVQLRPLVS